MCKISRSFLKIVDNKNIIGALSERGYRGHDYPQKLKVFKSGQKRGVTSAIKKELKRHSVIEHVIGHMKNED